jgi:hypothetical protein
MPRIRVYAHINPDALIAAGEKAGLPPEAVNYLRHFKEVELELSVDGESGAVVDCVVATESVDPAVCPCCGAGEGVVFAGELTQEETDEQTTGHFVECYGCGLQTAKWPTASAAITSWNQRIGTATTRY